ncbi:NUDIX domain-containing protein [Candidatus Micrarchaeota archaeon]|nr:NUDIX domain-containing protein [Candidatus Micrarchaeota archaeon]
MIKEKSCGVVLFRKGATEVDRRYLILQYSAKHWDFPKGHVEKGEDEIDTAKRETLEETGVDDLVFVPDFREHISYYYSMKGKKFYKDVYFFLAKTSITKIKLSHEHIGFEWLSYEEAISRLTYDNAKEILKKAENLLLKIK